MAHSKECTHTNCWYLLLVIQVDMLLVYKLTLKIHLMLCHRYAFASSSSVVELASTTLIAEYHFTSAVSSSMPSWSHLSMRSSATAIHAASIERHICTSEWTVSNLLPSKAAGSRIPS